MREVVVIVGSPKRIRSMKSTLEGRFREVLSICLENVEVLILEETPNDASAKHSIHRSPPLRCELFSPNIKGSVLQTERVGPLEIEIARGLERVVLRRARSGIIPLLYWGDEECLIASSSPAPLLRCIPPKGIHRTRLMSFLIRGDDEGTQDFFEGLSRCLPGGNVSWSLGRAPQQHRPSLSEAPREGIPLKDASHRLWSQLVEVLDKISPDDAAITLSGGLDSCAVLAAARASAPHKTWGVASIVSKRFQRFDESSAINTVERSLKLKSFHWSLDQTLPFRDLTQNMRAPEWGPVGIPGEDFLIPFHRAAKKHLKRDRFLTGMGSDQLFSSFGASLLRERQQVEPLWKWLPKVAQQRALWGTGARLLFGENHFQTLKSFLAPLRTPEQVRFPWQDPRAWYKPELRDFFEAERNAPLTPVFRDQWLHSWEWEEGVRSLRRVSRDAQVELLHPFLDESILDLSLEMSAQGFFFQGHSKSILREALRGHVSEEAVFRPKQGVFDEVIEAGLVLHHREIKALFHDSILHEMDLIDAGTFLKNLDACIQWILQRKQTEGYANSISLWRTLSAELWMKGLTLNLSTLLS